MSTAVEHSSGYADLDTAAEDAAARSTFRPEIVHGVAVGSVYHFLVPCKDRDVTDDLALNWPSDVIQVS